MTALGFESSIARWFESFIQLKLATGSRYQCQSNILRAFDRYLLERDAATRDVGAPLLGDYLASKANLAYRSKANLVTVIWPALDYASRHGADCPMLPQRPRFSKTTTRVPVIFSEKQISELLQAARHLCPRGGPKVKLMAHTYATFFGLLVTAGLRVGEARRLAVADLESDSGFLMIREGKFRKSRRLPLRSTTTAALAQYLDRQRAAGMPCVPESPLFVNRFGRPLVYENARQVFLHLTRAIGMEVVGALPTIHSLRHTFAVRRVIAWYRAGLDVNVRLQALSTYLGHSSVEHTLVYLKPHEEMLREAARRFEVRCAPPLPRSQEMNPACK